MNYNEFSTSKLIPVDDLINSRSKLDTGTFCNYECNFCYYLDRLDQKTPVEVIKERAKKIRDFGIKEIDLSGGESSLHEKWFEILDYCKEIGFSRISCLSNGYKFADKDFLQKSKEHGLSEILFSLHGYDQESHEKIVKRKGAYNRLLSAIKNSLESNLVTRINCTVTSDNAFHLDQFAKKINEIKPDQVNFLPLNYWEDASKCSPENYEVLASNIKKAIDQINPSIEINVRYIPYCFMVGYEKHVVGIFQHIFDLSDWNILTYNHEFQNQISSNDLSEYYKKAKEQRINTYTKPSSCFKCKYFFICDGVEHKALSNQGLNVHEGETILDPMHFRRNYQNRKNYE